MHEPSAKWKGGVLALFALSCAAVFVFMFTGTGFQLPFVSGRDYVVSFVTNDADNLVTASDVQIAGVGVGKVERIENLGPGGARVHLSLEPPVTPLHQGAEVRVGERSLVGEGIVHVYDGDGTPLESGAELPPGSVRPSVQLHDVVRDLDPETRRSLSGLVRSLGHATTGSEEQISQVLGGLGDLGREGHTAIDAIAAQSEDLTTLARQTSEVLRALNVSEGQIGTLVDNAHRITSATSGQADAVAATVRKLPGVLATARPASQELRRLSASLSPVAVNLKDAAPHLSRALNELPQTATDLRGMLPSLDETLGRAPGTLDRVPTLAGDLSAIVPTLRTTLSNLNPMLGYLQPYQHDLAAFFTNFGAIMEPKDEAGIHYLRLQPSAGNLQALTGVPLRLPDVLSWKNPYPHPGQAASPGPDGRGFTKIHPQPK